MKIIKLDRRHRFYRVDNMRYAVVFDHSDGWPNYGPYESWLRERFGPPWTTNEWRGGWPTMYGSKKYYIAVKDPSILTMMALAMGETVNAD
jgi:hypothetical protein